MSNLNITLKDELTLESLKTHFPWILKASIENAVIGLKNKELVWHSGIWRAGVWENGHWNDGIWKNGTWADGIWKRGAWINGTWESTTERLAQTNLNNFH